MLPTGAPNVLLILLDDAGYGQTATFGGLIPTPTLDTLASRGLRYTRFHVTALCSPTRAALLTGRNNHAVGMGTIVNWANNYPGYNGSIPKSAAFVSEILRENGYATASFGKWHLIPDAETTLAGPYDHWPTHQGFDYFYGFIGAETDQWHPELTEGTHPQEMKIPPGRENDYTLNEDLADHARAWILQQTALAPDRPLFMYYATGATHAPLQAPRAWIDRFKGKFDMGWDKYREETLARQKQLGVVPADTVLTPRPAELPAWDSLSPDQKKVAARLMEVFAGYMAQADFEIGRVIETLRQTGRLDNTLIVYIAGDNGASLEGNLTGTDNIMEQINGLPSSASEILKHLDTIGSSGTNPHYPAGWAWAGNTPFQWGKRIGSHLGGTRDPMVVSWPGHILDPGGVRSQYQHVIDVMPTILQAAGVPVPNSVDGVAQQRLDGVSFAPTFKNAKAPGRNTQYFEMHGNRAIYNDGWIAAQRSGLLPWAYALEKDARPAAVGALPPVRGLLRVARPRSDECSEAPADAGSVQSRSRNQSRLSHRSTYRRTSASQPATPWRPRLLHLLSRSSPPLRLVRSGHAQPLTHLHCVCNRSRQRRKWRHRRRRRRILRLLALPSERPSSVRLQLLSSRAHLDCSQRSRFPPAAPSSNCDSTTTAADSAKAPTSS